MPALMTHSKVLDKINNKEEILYSEILTITFSNGDIVTVTDKAKIKDILEKATKLTSEILKIIIDESLTRQIQRKASRLLHSQNLRHFTLPLIFNVII